MKEDRPVKGPMESYVRFFELQKPPFDAEGSRGVVLGTKALRKAFQEIKQGLEQGAPRICVSGSQGLGKTSLCRALPKLLADSARLVQIMNPHRPWQEIRTIIVRKLGLEGGALSRGSLLVAREDKPYLVIAIDQAELLSREALEHLDTLMRYRDDDDRQLVHCVLLANLEAAPAGGDVPLLWWLDQLTTLQLRFAPIPAQGIHHYIEKRLQKAGWSGGDLFSPQACLAVHRFTGGVPSAVNDLCERALSEASARGLAAIGSELIDELCDETIANALPPFDQTAFDDTSPSLSSIAASMGAGMDAEPGAGAGGNSIGGEAGISAQSLLDSTPLVASASKASRTRTPEPAPRAPERRPEPPRLELTSDPFVTSSRADAGPTLELSNDPFVRPNESEPRSTLELADGSDLGRADVPGRGNVAASGARMRRREPAMGRTRPARKPASRSNTRLLLLLLLAVLAGAAFPQLRDQSELIDKLVSEPVLETIHLRQAPAPVKQSTAKPGSVADMLDAIDDAAATLPEDLPTAPLADGEELENGSLEQNASQGPEGLAEGQAEGLTEGPRGLPGLEGLGLQRGQAGPEGKTPPALDLTSAANAAARPAAGVQPVLGGVALPGLQQEATPAPNAAQERAVTGASATSPSSKPASPVQQVAPAQKAAPPPKSEPRQQAAPARKASSVQQAQPAANTGSASGAAVPTARSAQPGAATSRTPGSKTPESQTPVVKKSVPVPEPVVNEHLALPTAVPDAEKEAASEASKPAPGSLPASPAPGASVAPTTPAVPAID